MAETGPRVFYLRDERKFPVACIASDKNGENVVFAMSVFNPKDNFDRERARMIATNRLKTGNVYGQVPLKDGLIKKAIMEVLAHETPLSHPEAQQRISRAAKLWLKTHKEVKPQTTN